MTLAVIEKNKKKYFMFTIKAAQCRWGTARRAMWVEISSSAAQLYDKSHFQRLALDEWPWRWL